MNPRIIPWIARVGLLVSLSTGVFACTSPCAGSFGYHEDKDGDGHGCATDCDDEDPQVHPGADLDGDGYDCVDDCNDADPLTFPGAVERCDGVDRNCNGSTLNEPGDVVYIDQDSDGHGCATDCNEASPNIYPGAVELCDDIDQNCDGSTLNEPGDVVYIDQDSDGHGCATDCNEASPNIYPGAVELCDDIDQNCDGSTLNEPGDVANIDQDGDGHDCATDCNEADPNTYPGAVELCDDIDQNCDGSIGNTLGAAQYIDQDGDGYNCVADCDDNDPLGIPGAVETCDDKDQNCDGIRFKMIGYNQFLDRDGDGYGQDHRDDVSTELRDVLQLTLSRCEEEGPIVSLRGDCDDTDPSIHPFAEDEAGDLTDSDCGGGDGQEPVLDCTATISGESCTTPQYLQAALNAFNSETLLSDAFTLFAVEGTAITLPDGNEGANPIYWPTEYPVHIKSVSLDPENMLKLLGDANISLIEFKSTESSPCITGPFDDQLYGATESSCIPVIIDGIHSNQVYFHANDMTVRLQNATFDGGTQLKFQNSSATLVNVRISNSISGNNSPLYMDSGRLTCIRCTLLGNGFTYYDVGATRILNSDFSVISSSYVKNVGRYAGAIGVDFADSAGHRGVISNSQFVGNFIKNEKSLEESGDCALGSAIRVKGDSGKDTLAVANSTFLNNGYSANTAHKSALLLVGSTLSVIDSVFSENDTDGSSDEFSIGTGCYDWMDTAAYELLLSDFESGSPSTLDYFHSNIYTSACASGSSECTEHSLYEHLRIKLSESEYSQQYSPIIPCGETIAGNTLLCDAPGWQEVLDPDAIQLHLASNSAMIDAGKGCPADSELNPWWCALPGSQTDLDTSAPDLGIYGGPLGGSLDMDRDGCPAYFWPGTYADVPIGVVKMLWDSDDSNADIHDCWTEN